MKLMAEEDGGGEGDKSGGVSRNWEKAEKRRR